MEYQTTYDVENGLYRHNIVSSTIQYYTTVEFNVGSKAECDQHMKVKKTRNMGQSPT